MYLDKRRLEVSKAALIDDLFNCYLDGRLIHISYNREMCLIQALNKINAMNKRVLYTHVF